jgi:hypothetical protein
VRTHVVVCAIALLALAVLPALAADVSGKWVAQVPGRDGQTREQAFTFKQDGEKLTGNVSTPMGEQEISEGKVSGDDISFVVVMKMQDREMKQLYKGKVAGSEIKFTREMQGGPGGGGRPPVEFTAKKA